MQPRILVSTSKETSFLFYTGEGRSFPLHPLPSARFERRGEVYAVVETAADRRWSNERIRRGYLREIKAAEIAGVRASNVMLVTDTATKALSAEQPFRSPYCTPTFLAVNYADMGFEVPADADADAADESAGRTDADQSDADGDGDVSAAKPAASVPKPSVLDDATSPEAVAAANARAQADGDAKDEFTVYRWDKQAWLVTPMGEIKPKDAVKLRYSDGSYVWDKQRKSGEFVCVRAAYIKTRPDGSRVRTIDVVVRDPVRPSRATPPGARKTQTTTAPPARRKR